MTIPLWGLVIFIGWTITVTCLLITLRVRHLAAGGAVHDFGVQDDKSLLWRLFRVQSNLAENLPLYLSVIFLLTVRGVSGTAIDFLAAIYMIFRLVHSVIHIAGMNPVFRVLCLAVQYVCLVVLIIFVL